MDRKPRLLWNGDICVPTGFARVTHNVLAHLSQTWDVAVLGINYRGDPHEYPYSIYPAAIGGDAWGIQRLPELCQRFAPDVLVMLNDPWNLARVFEQTTFENLPVVAYMPVDAKNLAPKYAKPLDRLDCAIWQTQFGLEEARKGGHTGWSEVIYHGVDLDIYKPIDRTEARRQLRLDQHIPDGAFVVGNVNRNHLRKRLDLTIAAFAAWVQRYRHDDAYLHLHCSTKDVGWDLPQLAEYYGISDRLILTDTAMSTWQGIAEEEMRAVYGGFDVQLSTTSGEGFGLTTLEGMACGIPQIVPDYAALGEWPKGAVQYVPVTSTMASVNGLNTITGVPDHEATVEALEGCYQNENLRQTLADRGLAKVHEPQYRWEHVAERFDEILRKIIAQDGKA
jgi:D-inositol-3-phosphate glycosyltransferase